MIDTLLHLQWREPLWLIVAAVPLGFVVWRWRRRARMLRYADAELLPWAASMADKRAGFAARAALEALAWLLLALAAAGPRLPLPLHDGQATPRHRLTAMVVLDVSASMRAADIAPDRLARARLELLDWLPRLAGERVGLVIYAGEAGVLLPPTDDAALLARALDQADPRLIEAPGTNLAAALDLARAQLAAAPGKAKAVLLVTDADADSVDSAAQDAVDALRAARVPLFVLGVGTEAGAPVPLPGGGWAEFDGAPVISRMATPTYRQWANASGGRFVAASDGDADWAALHDGGLGALPGDPLPPEAAAAWRELYAWCLLPALVLLMATALPRRVAALLALGVIGAVLAPPPALADEMAAWQAWQQRDYGRAYLLYLDVGGYPGQMGAGAAGGGGAAGAPGGGAARAARRCAGRWGAGAAAGRPADYPAAVRHFGAALLFAGSDAQRADALYNLGNAHYGRGQWQAAYEAYAAVLHLRPQDARAARNREKAWQKLRQERPETPRESDLGGRRGFIAEGRIQLDNQTGTAPGDPDFGPPGLLRGRDITGAGGSAASGAIAPRGGRVEPALALSGLKKLERLQDRPDSLLTNLLKQDARGDDAARRPW
ncbi:MAG: VWA domain-containing protein [Thiobacillus sp.]